MDRGGRGAAGQPRGGASHDRVLSSRPAGDGGGATGSSFRRTCPGCGPIRCRPGRRSGAGRVEAHVPDPLHAQRHGATGPTSRSRPRVRRGSRRSTRCTTAGIAQRRIRHPARRRRPQVVTATSRRLSEDVAAAELVRRTCTCAARRSTTSRATPTASEETLLDVPHYDFNWQTALPAGGAAKRCRRGRLITAGRLRQLGGEPGQSGPDEAGPLGRPDLGRDDDRVLRCGLPRDDARKAGTKMVRRGSILWARSTCPIQTVMTDSARRRRWACRSSRTILRRSTAVGDQLLQLNEILAAVRGLGRK